MHRGHAGPFDESPIKSRSFGIAEVGGNPGDRVARLGQPGQRHVPAQGVLDGAEAGAFVFQPAMDGAG